MLVAVFMLPGISSVQASASGSYTDATTEFCISKGGTLEVIGGDYNSATGAFAQGERFIMGFGNAYMEVLVPTSPVAPWSNCDFQSAHYSQKVKTLFSQFSYHFGTENFLLTDLPPPSVLF